MRSVPWFVSAAKLMTWFFVSCSNFTPNRPHLLWRYEILRSLTQHSQSNKHDKIYLAEEKEVLCQSWVCECVPLCLTLCHTHTQIIFCKTVYVCVCVSEFPQWQPSTDIEEEEEREGEGKRGEVSMDQSQSNLICPDVLYCLLKVWAIKKRSLDHWNGEQQSDRSVPPPIRNRFLCWTCHTSLSCSCTCTDTVATDFIRLEKKVTCCVCVCEELVLKYDSTTAK